MNRKPAALVTGSGRGIGLGIALELANSGFDVAGVDVVFEAGTEERAVRGQDVLAKLGGIRPPR
jgi:NAD(P)-dependent dehydrogenase (short-subunit alcohol dehydrogenase family)